MESIRGLRQRLKLSAALVNVEPRHVDTLLCQALECQASFLFAHADDLVPRAVTDLLEAQVQRLANSEPLQYVLGATEFYGRKFSIDPRALIPRPETELLVEHSLKSLPPSGRVLDVGSGSGCVAITIERERPDAVVFATDISIAALALTRQNARLLESEIRVVCGDLLAHLTGKFDRIVSNPPYISTADLEQLAPEVRLREPRNALSPGDTGLEIIDRLLTEATRLLSSDGMLLLEIGFGQSEAVKSLALGRGWKRMDIFDDYAGIPRVAVASRG